MRKERQNMDEKRIGYANESFYYGFSGEQSTIIRTEVTLSQEVIPDILHEALLLTLKRYPNFRRTLAVKDNNIFYRYNEKDRLWARRTADSTAWGPLRSMGICSVWFMMRTG